ncbi:MAG: polysaccharide deacetylase family protein [Oscillospiraceae bacterium]
MKTLQILVLGFFCALLMFFGVKTLFRADNAPLLRPDHETGESLSTTVDSDVDPIKTPALPDSATSEPTPPIPQTNKSDLLPLTISTLDGLSDKSIAWGFGKSVNEQNQSTACLALQEKYKDLGSVFIMDTNKVYLSFDLGYEAGFTGAILDTLKANDVKAIFFLTGSYAKKQEELVKRILAEGHTIGNHSATHADMTTLDDAAAKEEIMGMHRIMEEKYSYSPYLFRFPAGAFSEKSLAIAAQNGYHSVFWSFGYSDWDNAAQPEPTAALEKTTKALHKGGVYLLHPMETNSKILDELIKTARQQGFEFGVL